MPTSPIVPGRGSTARLLFFFALISAGAASAEPLPGTSPLELPRDDDVVHARCMRQVTEYFQGRIKEARRLRDRRWQPDFASAEGYETSIAPHRARLRKMLGLVDVDARVDDAKTECIAEEGGCRIHRVTIPMFGGLAARGLMFSSNLGRSGTPSHPVVIVCPDADTWPERFAGLTDGQTPPGRRTECHSVPQGLFHRLVAGGAIVFVPQSIERLEDHPYCRTTNGKNRRMILYRLGYPVGRTMPGLDVQDVTAAVDYLASRPDVDPDRIAIAGVGQGGMTALVAAAVDRRISAAAVVDYFQVREKTGTGLVCRNGPEGASHKLAPSPLSGWEEPVDRRLCGQLLEFGDAELAAMVAPRALGIVRSGEAPMTVDRVTPEVQRARRFYQRLDVPEKIAFASVDGGKDDALRHAVSLLAGRRDLRDKQTEAAWPEVQVAEAEARARRDLHFEERLKYLRRLIAESEAKREARWGLTTCPPQQFEQVKAKMLDDYRQLVGAVPTGDVPLNPKTELASDADRYKLYRITLDVTDNVKVYGNLLVPKEIREPAAAVICQHGLSGTPEMTTGLGIDGDTPYHEFARRLAEHGYVVFSPYLMQRKTDEINTLVRQADAVGMMRVAMPVAKTRRVVDFLQTLPFVDPQSIGYYGLSYGGYSAIWISPLEPRLAAVVISGHFNDWRTKITSDAKATSYLRHPDEDFYNWNVLHRFTHPELIAMIAPRPACVEFAERDGITTPEWTAYAWRQVVAWRDHIGLADRVVLAHFDGRHEIHAIEAVDFLDRFLRPSRPVGRDYGDMRFADGTATRYPHATEAAEPFITHVLDATPESRFAGRFWIPDGARQLRGMAVKIRRVGGPGPLEIRFGSRPDRDDLGTARVEAGRVPADGEPAWHELPIVPRAVSGGDLVYYNFRCLDGEAAGDRYVMYGPKPIGGKDFPDRFGLSYRVLTDRPHDALP